MIWVIYSLYMFIRGDNDIILDEDDLIGLFGDIYIYINYVICVIRQVMCQETR